MYTHQVMLLMYSIWWTNGRFCIKGNDFVQKINLRAINMNQATSCVINVFLQLQFLLCPQGAAYDLLSTQARKKSSTQNF